MRVEAANMKMQPLGWSIRDRSVAESPDGMGDNYNYFDQDDNSDLEEEPNKSTTSIKEDKTILNFLYNETRKEFKGIQLNL